MLAAVVATNSLERKFPRGVSLYNVIVFFFWKRVFGADNLVNKSGNLYNVKIVVIIMIK